MNKKDFLYINSLDYSYYKNKKHSIFPLHVSKIENLVNSKNKIFKTFDKENLLIRKKYLDKLRNKIFEISYRELNKINKINRSKKYWEIILMPWLFQFLDRTFHKYEMIKLLSIKKKYIVYNLSEKEIILPSSYENLSEIYNSDEWNYQISLEIIEYFFKDKFTIIKKKNNLILNKINKKKKKYNKIFFFKKKIFSKLFVNQKFVFLKGHLGYINYIKLNYNFNQLPNDFEILSKAAKFKKNFNIRNKNKLVFKIENEYENYIKDNFFKHLPVFFLELFKHYNNEGEGIMPLKPKVIFNINKLWWFTLPMFYTANKITLNKTKLIGYQHGCNYYLYDSFFHDHEINSCDLYLTWGWKLNQYTKRLGVSKTFDANKNKDSDKILIINRAVSKYFYNDSSNLNELQWSNYLKGLIDLPKIIDPNLTKKLVYRMHPSNNWNEKEYLKKKLPQICFDDNKIENSIKNSKIVICTQLDTTFLYCISSNIPVLTVFDFNRVKISKKNYLLLKNLQKQKILFENNDELCAHINKNYYNIEDWWNLKKVQKSISEFSNTHALQEPDLTGTITKYIRQITNSSRN